MHEVVEKYLAEKRQEEFIKKEKCKSEKLLSLGLYVREYSRNTSYTSEYPDYAWNAETQTRRYYRKVPIKVTDEEYEEILKYSNTKVTEERNGVATALKGIAVIIYIIGFIVGIFFAAEVKEITLIIVYWLVAFVNGTIFLGLGEIVSLLHKINNKK